MNTFLRILPTIISFTIFGIVTSIARANGYFLGALPTVLILLGSFALANFIIKHFIDKK